MYNRFNIQCSRREGTMSLDQPLERARELVQAGKNEEARELLEPLIKEDRHDISVWQLYAETWPKPKDKIRVWELCLRHNPGNVEAEQALASLGSRQEEKTKTKSAGETQPRNTGSKRSSPWLLWVSIGLLVMVAAFAVLAVRNAAPQGPAEYRHSRPVEYYLYVSGSMGPAEQDWTAGISGRDMQRRKALSCCVPVFPATRVDFAWM
jgi:hypothetical protein